MISAKDMFDRLVKVEKFYKEQLVIDTEIAILKAIADCKNPFVELTEWNDYLVGELKAAGYTITGDVTDRKGFITVWFTK